MSDWQELKAERNRRSVLRLNKGLSPDRRIEFRVGIHLGDIVEELTAT
jgi:class 3 adenylate cyclase